MRDIFALLSGTQLKLLLAVFAVCAIFFLTTGHQLFRRILLSRKIRGPSLWEVITVYGNQLFKTRLDPLMIDMSKRYNYKPWGVWAGLDYYVFISDADSIRDAFRSKSLKNKSYIAYSVFHDELGHNILSSNNLEWKRRRVLYNSSFKKSVLEPHLETIYEEVDKAIAKLRHRNLETDFDIRHLIESALARTVLKTVFSQDIDLDDKQVEDVLFYFGSVFGKIMTEFMKRVSRLCFLWLEKTDSKRHDEAKQFFRETNCRVIDKITQRLMKDHDSKKESILEAILSDNLNKQSLTRDELVSDTFLLFGAGVDTTSTSIAAVVYLLALHPEVQERATEEVRSVLGQSGDPIGADDLARLEYLERIIKESLRLFPPAVVIMRSATEDTDLNGTLVPKGANVLFNIYSLQRNPNSFKDPLKFDPDRFLTENQKLHDQYAYLPFSSGPRDCVGKVLAMFAMKMFLATLLRKYKILPGRGLNSIEDIEWHWVFTLHFYRNLVRLVPLSDNVP